MAMFVRDAALHGGGGVFDGGPTSFCGIVVFRSPGELMA